MNSLFTVSLIDDDGCQTGAIFWNSGPFSSSFTGGFTSDGIGAGSMFACHTPRQRKIELLKTAFRKSII